MAAALVNLTAGLLFFLFGMQMLSGHLQEMASGTLEQTLLRSARSPLRGLLLGTVLTMVLQSSSAVTVLLVCFANAGLLPTTVIFPFLFGANIGTTLLPWVLSLSGLSESSLLLQCCKPQYFSPVLAACGFLLTRTKFPKKQHLGRSFIGFFIMVYGMEFMRAAVAPLEHSTVLPGLLRTLSNPFSGLLAGTVLTAVIQSSTAAIGMLQALSDSGQISCAMALPLIMGFNIGTCSTAMLAAVPANRSAKQVAAAHLLINLLGTVVFFPLLLAGQAFDAYLVNQVGIAALHTGFNLASTVVLMPFQRSLCRLITRLGAPVTASQCHTNKQKFLR